MSKKCVARDRKKLLEKFAEYFERQRENLLKKPNNSFFEIYSFKAYTHALNLGLFVNNMYICIGTYYCTSSCV